MNMGKDMKGVRGSPMRTESRAEEDPFTTQEELFKEKLRERRAKPVTYEVLT